VAKAQGSLLWFDTQEYYPRFGFSSGKAKLLESPFPAEAFMAMELSSGALDGIQGTVIYPPAFGI
jgi:putative acetyltransferase